MQNIFEDNVSLNEPGSLLTSCGSNFWWRKVFHWNRCLTKFNTQNVFSNPLCELIKYAEFKIDSTGEREMIKHQVYSTWTRIFAATLPNSIKRSLQTISCSVAPMFTLDNHRPDKPQLLIVKIVFHSKLSGAEFQDPKLQSTLMLCLTVKQ